MKLKKQQEAGASGRTSRSSITPSDALSGQGGEPSSSLAPRPKGNEASAKDQKLPGPVGESIRDGGAKEIEGDDEVDIGRLTSRSPLADVHVTVKMGHHTSAFPQGDAFR